MSEEVIRMETVQEKIFLVRGIHVMLDSDLAKIYGVTTSRLNEQVRRNQDRFPEDFYFQLNKEEWQFLLSHFAIAKWGGRRNLPFVFTEHGVAGLSGVLRSEYAAQVHVSIIRAFIQMRKVIGSTKQLSQRIVDLEAKQITTENNFEKIFDLLEVRKDIPEQGVFFEGKVFDAYLFASTIIKTAKRSIVLIDNFINEKTIAQLAKKHEGVKAILLTKEISRILFLDVQKADEQYGGFVAYPFSVSHDRFLIIDEIDVYHLGASLKDLGKKWFAFSKLNQQSVRLILNEIAGFLH